jgi:hypothetical protein
MLKNIRSLKMIAASMALTTSCVAYSGDSYIAASLGFMDFEETVEFIGSPSLQFDSSINALNVRLGKNYTEYFSAEMRLGLGLGDDPVKVDGEEFDANLEMREMYGVYPRGGIQVDELFYPYVIVGYRQAKLEGSVIGFGIDGDLGGVSYGLGIDVDINNTVKGNIEYMSYFDTVGVEVAGFTLGLSKSF